MTTQQLTTERHQQLQRHAAHDWRKVLYCDIPERPEWVNFEDVKYYGRIDDDFLAQFGLSVLKLQKADSRLFEAGNTLATAPEVLREAIAYHLRATICPCDICADLENFALIGDFEHWQADHIIRARGALSTAPSTFFAEFPDSDATSGQIQQAWHDQRETAGLAFIVCSCEYCDRCPNSYNFTQFATDPFNWCRPVNPFGRFSILCSSCFDEYRDRGCFINCENCNELVTEERYMQHEDCGRVLCEDCYYDGHSCPAEGKVHPYEWEPEEFFFHKLSDEQQPRHLDGVYLGGELETQSSYGNYPAELASLVVDDWNESRVYLKEDGSVSGVEVVSHPATLGYHLSDQNGMNWSAILNRLIDEGHDADQNAGLHIHASKLGLGDTAADRESSIDNIIALLDIHWNKWTVLARRENLQWAPPNLGNYKTTSRETCADWNIETVRDVIETAKIDVQEDSSGRYRALNILPDDTIEFRFFGSTLEIEELRAAFQAVSLIIYFAKTRSLTGILTLEFGEILAAARSFGYSDFDNTFE